MTLVNPVGGVDREEDNDPLHVVRLDDFLKTPLPKRRELLTPWLPSQGLAMIYAPRGIGKTYLGLSIGLTIAGGGSLLGWHSPEPTSVVYVDGEMPAGDVQQRLARLLNGQDDVEKVANFYLINADQNFRHGMPDLSTPAGQRRVDNALPGDTGLIIVDNLSCLTSGNENDATDWKPVLDWLIRHRIAGRSVLLIHHSGKTGTQRGTSRREDNLDTVIALRRPRNYQPMHGARFEVHFEKNRGMDGTAATPFEARLETSRDGMSWLRVALTNKKQAIAEFLAADLSQAEIARQIGISPAQVSRYAKQIRESSILGQVP